jgi:ankyrin repeat protein
MTEENRTFDRLLQAFLHHDQNALEGLAQEGLSVDLHDSRGHTVLLRAAALGETAALEWILQAGAEVDTSSIPQASTSAKTAFLLAAEHGHPEAAEALLSSGADPNRLDGEGASALMLAARQGHLETVRFLVRSGVDLDLENHQGANALTLAQSAGHGDIVALLHALGAAGSNDPRGSIASTKPPPEVPELNSQEPTSKIADQEWQTPPAPQILQPRPLRAAPSEESIGDHFNDLINDHIEDQISDWIEDQAADL